MSVHRGLNTYAYTTEKIALMHTFTGTKNRNNRTLECNQNATDFVGHTPREGTFLFANCVTFIYLDLGRVVLKNG